MGSGHRVLVAEAHDPCHLSSSVFERDAQRSQRAGGDAFFLAKRPEQKVLGPDVVVFHRTGLVLREDDDLSRPLGEALEHGASLALSRGGGLCSPPLAGALR